MGISLPDLSDLPPDLRDTPDESGFIPFYELGRWVQLTGVVTYKSVYRKEEHNETQYIIRIKVVDHKAKLARGDKPKKRYVNVIFYDNPHHPFEYLKNLEKGREVIADCITSEPAVFLNLKESKEKEGEPCIEDTQSQLRGMFIRDAAEENVWEGYKKVLTHSFFVDDDDDDFHH